MSTVSARLCCVAEFERALIVERVSAGVAEAKRKGILTGRPRRVFRRGEAVRLKREGHSYQENRKAARCAGNDNPEQSVAQLAPLSRGTQACNLRSLT
jgi:hypothetical protein